MKISDLPASRTIEEIAINVAHIADELAELNMTMARIAAAMEARLKESEDSLP